MTGPAPTRTPPRRPPGSDALTSRIFRALYRPLDLNIIDGSYIRAWALPAWPGTALARSPARSAATSIKTRMHRRPAPTQRADIGATRLGAAAGGLGHSPTCSPAPPAPRSVGLPASSPGFAQSRGPSRSFAAENRRSCLGTLYEAPPARTAGRSRRQKSGGVAPWENLGRCVARWEHVGLRPSGARQASRARTGVGASPGPAANRGAGGRARLYRQGA
jgi:hypothetical protein